MSYPSDLSDAEWSLIKAYFPEYAGHCRPRKHAYRDLLNAILYVMRTGCQWRMIPKDFPPWDSVYHYYRKWQRDGTWDTIHNELRQKVRQSVGKEATPSIAIIDSQSVKTVQKGGNAVTTQGRRLKDVNATLPWIR